MKRALSFFLTCILLLGLLPTAALAADPPAEQLPNLTPGDTYWFDLSGEGFPGEVVTGLPDPDLHWVPFTYAGTINAYSRESAGVSTDKKVTPYDHSLFIADYAVTYKVSWNDLNQKNLIFGRYSLLRNMSYTLRAPSVGSQFSSGTGHATPESNEWDRILNKSDNYIKNIGGIYGQGSLSWGQDSRETYNDQRISRGDHWQPLEATTQLEENGFRPALEIPDPDNFNCKVVELDLNGGSFPAAGSNPIKLVVGARGEFSAPSADILTPPKGKRFSCWQFPADPSCGTYVAGETIIAMPDSQDPLILQACWVSPLTIAQQPRSTTVSPGGTAHFTVSYSGGDYSPSHQWQVNKGGEWEDIPGATKSSYTTGPTDASMNGWQYRCVLTALSGAGGRETATSDAAMLICEQYPALDPGEIYWFDLSGEDIPGTVNTSVPDTTLHWVPFTYTGTINAYKLTSNQTTTEEYANQNRYTHSLFIADYNVTNKVPWNDLNNQSMIFGKSYTSGGVSYTMRAPSAGSSYTGSGDSVCGVPQINEWDMILNKLDSYIKNWENIDSWGQDTSSGASSDRALRGYHSARSWNTRGSVTLVSTGTGFRPVLELPDPAVLTSGLQIVTLDLNGGRIGSETGSVNIAVKSGESFTAPGGEGLTAPDGKAFGGWKDSNTLYKAGETVPSSVTTMTAYWVTPPSITTQPADKTVSVEEMAEFSIAAADEPAPTYQWQVSKDSGSSWEDISGATNSSYTTEAATADMNGWQYRCVVSNSQGSATSNAATLMVNASYQIVFTGGQADGPTQITLYAATVTPSGGTVTYAKNTVDEAPADGWQTGLVFSGLTAGTTYYFFAKAAASGNYLETVSPGVAIATPVKSVSGIQITAQPANLAYTSGQALDLSGLSVTVTYDDGTSETIDWSSGKLTADPAQGTALTVSEHNGKGVAISFGGKTASTNALTVTQGTQPPTKYLVTVNGGTGGGNFAEGDTVAITATVPSGQRFTGWTVNAGGVTLADPTSAATSFTMPAQAVTVTANFEATADPTYLVTVNGGTGGGSYVEGSSVTITATVPSGRRFTGWTVNAGGVTLANASSATTTFTMPAQAVTVTANFENTPDPAIPVTSVMLNKASMTLTVGGSERLTATVAPSDATDKSVTWVSSNTAIVTVDASGTVTAVSTGTVTITVTTVDGTKTATCTVTVRTNNSGGGGGGMTSAPSNPAVTAPVSGDKSTVNVSASVSGTTATVSKIDTTQIENIIGDNGQASMVEIDFTGLGRIIDTVKLPAAAIKVIAAKAQNEEVGGLTVKLSDGELSFDAKALSAIQAQAGSQITLILTPAKPADLNSRQKEAVGSTPVFELTLRGGSGTITDFWGGYATVSLPYTLATGQDPSGVVVYYLDGTGNITPCTTMYDVRSKSAIFTTSHLSLYFVGYDPTAVWVKPFSDVAEDAWYYNAVRYVNEHNLMGGYGGGLFGPNDHLTRAQFAQVLFNRKGRPVVNYLLQYSDVAEGTWYTEAICWATSQRIVNGYGNGMFGPNDNITREQLAVILWRYAGSPATAHKELHFNDTDEISGFALEALRWAVEHGIINGYGDGRLGPQGLATRAQVAQMLKNFFEKG